MQHSSVPWQDRQSWHQVELFFHASLPHHEKSSRMLSLVESISADIKSLDKPLQQLCAQTCPNCKDNCCARATVWYDFRDLVFLYLLKGKLPPEQIRKKADLSCGFLAPTGCRLERMQRPFLCTWYLCGSQKRMTHGDWGVEETLSNIQQKRKVLEAVFIDRVSSSPSAF